MVLKRLFRKLRYATLLLKISGPKIFLSRLKNQLYSRDSLYRLVKNLDTKTVPASCGVVYSLRQACDEDFADILEKAKMESRESAYELIERKWFWESGFHSCYAAQTGSGEVCFMGWFLSSQDSNVVKDGFKSRLPELKKDELLLENFYTFEKYRGKNIMPSVLAQVSQEAKSKGFNRIIAYVRQDNTASIRALEKVGFSKSGAIPELKFLLRTKREHN
ncbi:MAG: GNAT family N-acetyltransferase [Chloroflexi bacterium]|nr:GNAT family N-acetyltransferase [Chloroflexota bacterium]